MRSDTFPAGKSWQKGALCHAVVYLTAVPSADTCPDCESTAACLMTGDGQLCLSRLPAAVARGERARAIW